MWLSSARINVFLPIGFNSLHQGSEVKYLTLTNLEEVVGLFNAQEGAGGLEGEEEEEEEEEEREHADDWSELGKTASIL